MCETSLRLTIFLRTQIFIFHLFSSLKSQCNVKHFVLSDYIRYKVFNSGKLDSSATICPTSGVSNSWASGGPHCTLAIVARSISQNVFAIVARLISKKKNSKVFTSPASSHHRSSSGIVNQKSGSVARSEFH